MNTEAWEHLFGWRHALENSVTLVLVTAIGGLLTLAPIVLFLVTQCQHVRPELRRELWLRWRSWVWLATVSVIPVLAGAAWTMVAVAVLSGLCFREFSRATGLFREQAISVVVFLGIGTLLLANLDHFDRMFFALAALTVCVIAVVTLFEDRPKGYLQRVALGMMGFLLFGYALGYLGLLANHAGYRPLLLFLLLSVELNDVFAFCCGRAFGKTKLLPNTSPGKTVAGALGALLLTTGLVIIVGRTLFSGTVVARLDMLLRLGVLISVLGQLGDLILSSVKRDLGLKDLGTSIAGHGGWLDRFESLVLVPPAVYHFLSYQLGPLGLNEPSRILTGGTS